MKYFPEDLTVSIAAIVGYSDVVQSAVAAGRLLTDTVNADLASSKNVLKHLGGDLWEGQEPIVRANTRDYQLGRIAAIQALDDTNERSPTGFS